MTQMKKDKNPEIGSRSEPDWPGAETRRRKDQQTMNANKRESGNSRTMAAMRFGRAVARFDCWVCDVAPVMMANGFVCPKCGRATTGKNYADQVKNWNDKNRVGIAG
jgi:hypothetical protein